MKAIHIQFEGYTASFRHPLMISGTQISTPVPAFSTLLGLISACAGRIINPSDTRIGFEYVYQAEDYELERTIRWQTKGNQLKLHPKGRGIMKRQVHFYPKLDLYVSNENLLPFFLEPAATPCLGRSQDVAWITKVEEIDLIPVTKGHIGKTLLPSSDNNLPGLILRLPEWFENNIVGEPRQPGPFGQYRVTGPGTIRMQVEHDNLYVPSDAIIENQVIYLHQWTNNNEVKHESTDMGKE